MCSDDSLTTAFLLGANSLTLYLLCYLYTYVLVASQPYRVLNDMRYIDTYLINIRFLKWYVISNLRARGKP